VLPRLATASRAAAEAAEGVQAGGRRLRGAREQAGSSSSRSRRGAWRLAARAAAAAVTRGWRKLGAEARMACRLVTVCKVLSTTTVWWCSLQHAVILCHSPGFCVFRLTFACLYTPHSTVPAWVRLLFDGSCDGLGDGRAVGCAASPVHPVTVCGVFN
jgi:hypothetical protein